MAFWGALETAPNDVPARHPDRSAAERRDLLTAASAMKTRFSEVASASFGNCSRVESADAKRRTARNPAGSAPSFRVRERSMHHPATIDLDELAGDK